MSSVKKRIGRILLRKIFMDWFGLAQKFKTPAGDTPHATLIHSKSIDLLPCLDVRGFDFGRYKLAVNQILHCDWSFKNSRFDRHVMDSLQVFISWRQHSITDAIRRLGQDIADDFLILP